MLSRNIPAQNTASAAASVPAFAVLSPATLMAMQCMGCGGPMATFVTSNWYAAVYERIQRNYLAAAATQAAKAQDVALQARSQAGRPNNFASSRNLNTL